MTNTSELRRLWGPPCTGPFVKLNLYGEGVVTVKAAAATAFRALNDVLEKHDYQTRRADTGGYNCRKITGGDGYSLHAYGISIDINWLTNPYGSRLVTDMPMSMIEDIEAIRTKSGHAVFRWGGRYAGNKDAMHFEIICSPAQLATGIKLTAIAPAQDEEDDMDLAGNPSWAKRQPNNRFPVFIGHSEKEWNSFAVLSRDNAVFDPPWKEGRKDAGSEDGIVYGLWFRRFFNTGVFYGFGEADDAFFAVSQNGTYDLAKAPA